MLHFTIHFINLVCLILLNLGLLVFFSDFVYTTFQKPWTPKNILIAIMNTLVYALFLTIGAVSLWLNITQGVDIWNV